MKVIAKIYVLLAYSVLAGTWYALDPDSGLLSVPYGMFIVRILEPFMPVSFVSNILLVPATDSFTAPYIVRMLDVCVGFFLLASSGLFLWLRGASKKVIIGTSLGLFMINTFRVILVFLVLRTYGYAVAAIVHDLFYAGFTALAIGIMSYGVYGAYLQLTKVELQTEVRALEPIRGVCSARPLRRRRLCP